MTALQAQSPEFKPQSNQKINKQKKSEQSSETMKCSETEKYAI
jgi:hypothetical protein